MRGIIRINTIEGPYFETHPREVSVARLSVFILTLPLNPSVRLNRSKGIHH